MDELNKQAKSRAMQQARIALKSKVEAVRIDVGGADAYNAEQLIYAAAKISFFIRG